MRVKVSVIMSVFDPHPFSQFEKAVESVMSQTLKEWELLIYNDGSSGEYRERILRLAERDPRIRYLEGSVNRGIAYGLNQCIRHAEGRFLARMDADDISLPERLERQTEFLEQHPEYDYVGCSAFLISGEEIWGRRSMPERPKKEDFLLYSPFIHPSVTFRREVFEKYGGYSLSRQMLRCEDYDLFMRLYISGSYGYNLQEELFCYREDRESFRKRRLRFRLDETRLRARWFSRMGLGGVKGLLYRYRPLAGGLIPAGICRGIKRYQASGKQTGSSVPGLSVQGHLEEENRKAAIAMEMEREDGERIPSYN